MFINSVFRTCHGRTPYVPHILPQHNAISGSGAWFTCFCNFSSRKSTVIFALLTLFVAHSLVRSAMAPRPFVRDNTFICIDGAETPFFLLVADGRTLPVKVLFQDDVFKLACTTALYNSFFVLFNNPNGKQLLYYTNITSATETYHYVHRN